MYYKILIFSVKTPSNTIYAPSSQNPPLPEFPPGKQGSRCTVHVFHSKIQGSI